MTSRRDYEQNYDRVAKVCAEWWRGLHGLDVKTGEDNGSPNRAAIAKLRRIGTVTIDGREEMDTATQLGHYAALYARLKGPASAPFRPYREQDDFAQAVAMVAGTLARVRNEANGKTAALLGGAARRKKAPHAGGAVPRPPHPPQIPPSPTRPRATSTPQPSELPR